jgi:hypothetical protein
MFQEIAVMWELFISWLIGTLTGAATAVSIEALKNHSVDVKIALADEAVYPGKPARTSPNYAMLQDFPAQKGVYLCLEAVNHPLPRWARWMSRSTAVQCRGELTFLYESGLPVFARPMPIRWVDAPEPLPMYIVIDNKKVPIYDPNAHHIPDSIDIYANRSRKFNIAAKFDDEDDCYAWNNENYTSIPEWRNPYWKLPRGRYFLVVDLNLCGAKLSRVFALFNEGVGENFRIGPVQVLISANRKSIKTISIKKVSQFYKQIKRIRGTP